MTDTRDAAKATAEGPHDDGRGSGGNNSSRRDGSGDVIGHGTWLDKLAYELVCREESLGRD